MTGRLHHRAATMRDYDRFFAAEQIHKFSPEEVWFSSLANYASLQGLRALVPQSGHRLDRVRNHEPGKAACTGRWIMPVLESEPKAVPVGKGDVMAVSMAVEPKRWTGSAAAMAKAF